MKQPSRIGANDPFGGQFVYCHMNGHPIAVGRALREIIDRDGAEHALSTILQQGALYGWSTIQPHIRDREPAIANARTVPGYGVAFTASPDTGLSTLEESLRSPRIEYVYDIRPDGAIDIYESYGDGRAWRWRLDPGVQLESTERPAHATQFVIGEEAGA